jgi:hypothetical protein
MGGALGSARGGVVQAMSEDGGPLVAGVAPRGTERVRPEIEEVRSGADVIDGSILARVP